MIFDIQENNGTINAALKGRLDTAAAAAASSEIQPLIDHADKEIVIDCKELEYISSSGLRLLLTVRKATIAQGGKVVMKNINDDIRQVFTMTGFMSLFEIQ